jgi:two-component system sensor histidine kinase DevS
MTEIEPDVTIQEKLEEIISPSRYPFSSQTLTELIPPCLNLMKMDACEIYLSEKGKSRLYLYFHAGSLLHIWNEGAPASPKSLLASHFDKGEFRIINLPNQRIDELNPELRQKAFGQVVCLPLLSDGGKFGIAYFAHTRRNLLTDQESNFLKSVILWAAGMIHYEIKNLQARSQIITEERERIGMDLHDGIIQSLYGIGLSLENARLNVSQGKNNGVEQIEKSLEALQSAIADIRAYILDLRPKQLRHSNMVDGMRSLIREFRANTMVEVEFEGSPEDVEGLARTQIDALYHIFQEALSNTAKHAKATKVSIRLWRRGERVMLKVSDDGLGFEPPKPGGRQGHGLTNMQARAEAAGGGMEVISIRKQGTNLLAWVPYIKE